MRKYIATLIVATSLTAGCGGGEPSDRVADLPVAEQKAIHLGDRVYSEVADRVESDLTIDQMSFSLDCVPAEEVYGCTVHSLDGDSIGLYAAHLLDTGSIVVQRLY